MWRDFLGMCFLQMFSPAKDRNEMVWSICVIMSPSLLEEKFYCEDGAN